MRAYQQFMLEKSPHFKPKVYTDSKRKLFCIEITDKKSTGIDIFFKSMGDMVDFIQNLARQIEPAGGKDARNNRKSRK